MDLCTPSDLPRVYRTTAGVTHPWGGGDPAHGHALRPQWKRARLQDHSGTLVGHGVERVAKVENLGLHGHLVEGELVRVAVRRVVGADGGAHAVADRSEPDTARMAFSTPSSTGRPVAREASVEMSACRVICGRTPSGRTAGETSASPSRTRTALTSPRPFRCTSPRGSLASPRYRVRLLLTSSHGQPRKQEGGSARRTVPA